MILSVSIFNRVLLCTPSINCKSFVPNLSKGIELKSKTKLSQTIFMLIGGGTLQMLPTHLKSLEIRSVTQLG